LRMLNLLRAGWVLDFVFIPAEWQVQTQSGQRFFNSCGMLVNSNQISGLSLFTVSPRLSTRESCP
jgi:hypothetical protein